MSEPKMTEQQKIEARKLIAEMQALSLAFYASAQRLGVHAFIEHTGLMNEHIKVLERGVEAGVDPRMVNAHCGDLSEKMVAFEGAYLGEKFSCIFSPVLSKESWEAFRTVVESELGLPKKRGCRACNGEPGAPHVVE